MEGIEKKCNVLVVEDDFIMRSLALIILSELGYCDKIVTSSNGFEALESIEINGLPDYIFLDLEMPEMNGYSFLEEFQKRYKRCLSEAKIFILSNMDYYQYKDKINCYQFVAGYLKKPLKKETVLKLLNS